MELTGKNKDFTVTWNCVKQSYTVFYKGKVLIQNKYKFSDIQSYLD